MRFMETIFGVLSLPVTCWNDLERSKAPKDHHCVEAASHWLLSGRRDPRNHTQEKNMAIQQQRVKAEPQDSTSMTSVSESSSDLSPIKTSVIWLCYDCGGKTKRGKIVLGPEMPKQPECSDQILIKTKEISSSNRSGCLCGRSSSSSFTPTCRLLQFHHQYNKNTCIIMPFARPPFAK